MTRMTKSISLVLVSSSLILAGCPAPTPLEETKEEEKGTSHSGRGFHPRYYGGGHSPGAHSHTSGSSSGRPGGHVSSHSGGFGGSGHAVGS